MPQATSAKYKFFFEQGLQCTIQVQSPDCLRDTDGHCPFSSLLCRKLSWPLHSTKPQPRGLAPKSCKSMMSADASGRSLSCYDARPAVAKLPLWGLYDFTVPVCIGLSRQIGGAPANTRAEAMQREVEEYNMAGWRETGFGHIDTTIRSSAPRFGGLAGTASEQASARSAWSSGPVSGCLHHRAQKETAAGWRKMASLPGRCAGRGG